MSLSVRQESHRREPHPSYDELTAQLAREFSNVERVDVAREVARAVAAARFTGLDVDEELGICALIARQQLQLLTGRRADAARLDPQVHPARSVYCDNATECLDGST